MTDESEIPAAAPHIEPNAERAPVERPLSERPLSERPLEERLLALAALARALDASDEGPVGGFWPDAVWLEGESLQVALDRTRSSAERFAERLSRAENLSDVAFMAPEIASDTDGVHAHAADAYSFAALVYIEATGRAPIGRLDVGKLQAALGHNRFGRILDGLSPDPLLRPTLNELAQALAPAPVGAARGGTPRARGPVGTRSSDADGNAVVAPEASRSFVRPLLMVGAVSVFVGALWFIWLAWILLSDFPRLLLIVGFTAAIGWCSELLARYTFDEAAKTLRVLFTQLFWAVGGMLLVVTGTLKSSFGWAFVALLVALVSGVVAMKRGPKSVLVALALVSTLLALVLIYADLGAWGRVVLMVGLSVGARLVLFLGEGLSLSVRAPVGTAHVLTNAIAAAHAIFALWPNTAMHLFSHSGGLAGGFEFNPEHLPRFVAVIVVVGIAWGVSRHFTHQAKLPWLTMLLNAMLAFGLLLLLALTWRDGASCFAVVPPLVALVEVWIALRVRRETTATLPWLVFSSSLWITCSAFLADIRWLTSLNVAVVGAGLWALTVILARIDRSLSLATLSTLNLAIAALALGDHLSTGSYSGPATWLFLIACLYVALGVFVLRRDENLRLAHTGAAGLFCGGAIVSALLVLADATTGSDEAAFGSVFPFVPAVLFSLLLVAKDRSSRLLGSAAFLTLFALPGVEVVMRSTSREHTLVAVVMGLIGVTLGLLVFKSERLERTLGGDAKARIALFVFVSTATTLAPSIIGAFMLIGRPLASVVEQAMLVVLPLGALFGLGMGAMRLERAREGRTLQLVATAVYLGVFTLASFAAAKDYGHPALLMLGGVVLLALGTRTRHAHVVFLSSSALMLAFWTQFFMKLHSHAPMSVLLIVFGVGVLVGGVLYEKHVKALVTNVRSWPGI